MIPAGVVVAFFAGLVAETAFLVVSDRRAIRSERLFWDQLRADAQLNYGRVFDWAEEPDL